MSVVTIDLDALVANYRTVARAVAPARTGGGRVPMLFRPAPWLSQNRAEGLDRAGWSGCCGCCCL